MTSDATGTAAGPLSLELANRHRLVVDDDGKREAVFFLNADGEVTLSIQLTEKGPVLRFEGATLALQAAGSLSIGAEHVHLHGRQGLALTSEGDIAVATPGDLHTEARIQNLSATLGNVNVRANDDIRLNGERVLVNC